LTLINEVIRVCKDCALSRTSIGKAYVIVTKGS
jgi:hypothetical protein